MKPTRKELALRKKVEAKIKKIEEVAGQNLDLEVEQDGRFLRVDVCSPEGWRWIDDGHVAGAATAYGDETEARIWVWETVLERLTGLVSCLPGCDCGWDDPKQHPDLKK
jgi:hypothetical protein